MKTPKYLSGDRNFSGIEITPEDVMKVRLEHGDIKLSEYMQWLVTDRSWESVKESVMDSMINRAPQQ